MIYNETLRKLAQYEKVMENKVIDAREQLNMIRDIEKAFKRIESKNPYMTADEIYREIQLEEDYDRIYDELEEKFLEVKEHFYPEMEYITADEMFEIIDEKTAAIMNNDHMATIYDNYVRG